MAERHVVACGGAHYQSDALWRYLLDLAGKERPRITLLPTASADRDDSILGFYERLANQRGGLARRPLRAHDRRPARASAGAGRHLRLGREHRLDARGVARARGRRDPARGVGAGDRPRGDERGRALLVRGRRHGLVRARARGAQGRSRLPRRDALPALRQRAAAPAGVPCGSSPRASSHPGTRPTTSSRSTSPAPSSRRSSSGREGARAFRVDRDGEHPLPVRVLRTPRARERARDRQRDDRGAARRVRGAARARGREPVHARVPTGAPRELVRAAPVPVAALVRAGPRPRAARHRARHRGAAARARRDRRDRGARPSCERDARPSSSRSAACLGLGAAAGARDRRARSEIRPPTSCAQAAARRAACARCPASGRRRRRAIRRGARAGAPRARAAAAAAAARARLVGRDRRGARRRRGGRPAPLARRLRRASPSSCASDDPAPARARFAALPEIVALARRPTLGVTVGRHPDRAPRRAARRARHGARPRDRPRRARRGARAAAGRGRRGGASTRQLGPRRPPAGAPRRRARARAAAARRAGADPRRPARAHDLVGRPGDACSRWGIAARDARLRVPRDLRPHAERRASSRASTATRCAGRARRSPPRTSALAPFRILRGVECDIRDDGSLDAPDDVLAELDWVQLSLHRGQRAPRARADARASPRRCGIPRCAASATRPAG